MALRAGFLVISILLGLTVGSMTGAGTMRHAAVGAVAGGLLGGVLVLVESFLLERFPLRVLVAGSIGFGLGLFLSGLSVFLMSLLHLLFPSSSMIVRGKRVGRPVHVSVPWTRVGRSLRQGFRGRGRDRREVHGTGWHAQIAGYERDHRRPHCRPV